MHNITIGDWTKLGSTIKAERTRAGLTQHELATRAGISRSWLAKVEAGHRGAELEQILRLLAALGLSMSLRSEAADPEFEQGAAATPSLRHILDSNAILHFSNHHRQSAATRRGAWSAAAEAQLLGAKKAMGDARESGIDDKIPAEKPRIQSDDRD